MSSQKIIFALFALLLLVLFFSLGIGRYEQPSDEQGYTVFTLIRLPRVLFAILVGAALASSGAVYQGLFKNPLVSPDILGVSSGAAVGASVAIILNFNYIGVQLSAFACGLFAVFAVVFISSIIAKGRLNLLVMVLLSFLIQTSSLRTLAKVPMRSLKTRRLPS